MRETATCATCARPFLREPGATWKSLCLTCWRETKATAAPAPAPVSPIPQDVLRKLIQLCHPDRHGGSQAAHAATQWLLEQRGRG